MPAVAPSLQKRLCIRGIGAEGCENDIKFQLLGRGAAGSGVLGHIGGEFLEGLEVDDEVVFDGEDGVGCEPGVVLKCKVRQGFQEDMKK